LLLHEQQVALLAVAQTLLDAAPFGDVVLDADEVGQRALLVMDG